MYQKSSKLLITLIIDFALLDSFLVVAARNVQALHDNRVAFWCLRKYQTATIFYKSSVTDTDIPLGCCDTRQLRRRRHSNT
jgi:uncharacterized protein (UPF0303 family)